MKIVVVGAGIAGITAAYYLAKNKHDDLNSEDGAVWETI